MKVLLVDVNCKYSSTGKIVYDLYTQLREEGHEAAICYGRGPLVEGKNIWRFSPTWEVYLHVILTRITGYTGRFSPIATRRLLKYIDKFQPDVVHLHDMHGYFVDIVPLISYLKKNNIKTVWTQHCEFMYTGKCGYAYDCNKWQEKCSNCERLKDYPKTEFFDKTDEMYDEKKNVMSDFKTLQLVAPSEWLAKRIKKSFMKDKKISVIYNGIDTSVFYRRNTDALRQKYGLTDEKVVLAVAPNLMSERKGGKYVIELARRMGSEKIKFFMIGVKKPLEIQEKNVFAEEIISDQNLLAKFYSMADVFLICSEKENYPTTCVEAAACGTPVVGFNVGGTAETVSKNAGLFVEYGDIIALQSVTEKVLVEQREKYISKKNYSMYYMYKQYLELYK